MDIKKLQKSTAMILQKYKYVVLVLAVGLILMLLPSSGGHQETVIQTDVDLITEVTIQEQLEEILSCIQGAGKVKVMLTETMGEETVYQCDQDQSISDTTSTVRSETGTVTDAQRNESGLICQVNPPKYLGAIILCQGADDPALKLAIAHAVSKITGLGTDKIAILKMK